MEALSTGIKKMERILKMVDDEKHGDWTHWSSLTAAGFVCVSGSQSGMILPPRGHLTMCGDIFWLSRLQGT